MTGSLFPFSVLNLSSHSVSVQRRDRSLFFLLHCYTKSPLFICFPCFSLTQCVCPKTWQVTVLFTALLYQGPSFCPFLSFSLGSFVSLLDFCLRYLFTVCLSKDVAGTLFPLLILFDLSATSSFFCLHSVSVQRRDRYSVSFFLFRLPPLTWGLAALFWLHSVSVQRRGRCSVTYTTYLSLVLRTPFPPPFFV